MDRKEERKGKRGGRLNGESREIWEESYFFLSLFLFYPCLSFSFLSLCIINHVRREDMVVYAYIMRCGKGEKGWKAFLSVVRSVGKVKEKEGENPEEGDKA